MIKRILQAIFRGLMVFIGLLLLYGLLAIILGYLPSRGSYSSPPTSDSTVTLYVGTNGVHLDFFVPRDALPPRITEAIPMHTLYPWVGMGWGELNFFTQTPTWADLTFSTAAKAVFWPSEGALHVSYYRSVQPHWRKVTVSRAGWQALLAFMEGTLDYQEGGTLIEIEGAGYPARDHFYQANYRYFFGFTCNNWVNLGLKKAGRRTSLWSPFDFTVLHHLDKYEEHQTP